MRYRWLVVVGWSGCSGEPEVEDSGTVDPLGASDTEDSSVDSSSQTTDSGTGSSGTEVCDPVWVPLSGTPRAATVVLEPDLCECAVLAISQGLPGLVLTYNTGVGYGQGDAVGGWLCAAAEGNPTPEIFGGGAAIAGLAYDQPYSFRMVHAASGVEARVRARISSDVQVELLEQSWIGCP